LDGTIIREGSTQLLVPSLISEKGPGKIEGRVFFNRQMAFNRDVSVALFHSVVRPRKCLDAMAATGARGIRICNEAPGNYRFIINDKDSLACEHIKHNIELNSLENAEVCNADLRCLLAEEIFDYIDLDPFGTPIPFVPSALQGMARKGILAVTATDTASLSGTHPGKCRRRYMANSQRNPFLHESGLRIMIGTIVMVPRRTGGEACSATTTFISDCSRTKDGSGGGALCSVGHDVLDGRRGPGSGGHMGDVARPLMAARRCRTHPPGGLECDER
jgi:tRNA (guanine26-N2/guanine27-N2)-dimethyltransferase